MPCPLQQLRPRLAWGLKTYDPSNPKEHAAMHPCVPHSPGHEHMNSKQDAALHPCAPHPPRHEGVAQRHVGGCRGVAGHEHVEEAGKGGHVAVGRGRDTRGQQGVADGSG